VPRGRGWKQEKSKGGTLWPAAQRARARRLWARAKSQSW